MTLENNINRRDENTDKETSPVNSSEKLIPEDASETVLKDNNVTKESEAQVQEKTEKIREEINDSLGKDNAEQAITPELQEKMNSFEKKYNSGEIHKLLGALNLENTGYSARYDFDEKKQRHVFLKKGMFGYKNIFNEDQAEQMNSIINNAAEILSISEPLINARLTTEIDPTKKRVVVYGNFDSFFRKTMDHIREVKKG